MRFRKAVEEAGIGAWYEVGLGALLKRDRDRIRCSDSRKLSGSVSLEDALREVLKGRRLWDYAIGVRIDQKDDAAVFVEIHPAASTNVSEVLGKLTTLREWLAREGQALASLRSVQFIWVASGRVAIPRGSPHARRLAAAGLDYPRPVHQLN